MDINATISQLLQEHGGLCLLDKIHLPYGDDASAGPAAKFGLGCVLFMPNSDRSQMREQALRFLLDYQTMFPERVNEFLARDARRSVKFTGDLEKRTITDYNRYPVESGCSNSLFGAVDTGLPNDDVQPYQANTLICRASEPDLSFVSAHMPVCGDKASPQFEVLLQAVLRWSALCRPVHGVAGFALTFSSGMSQNTKYALMMMKRFPGLEVLAGVDFTMEAGTEHHRIKGVNWLTVLCDALVDELGRLDKMKNMLEPVCKVHTYDGGVVIQAGAYPQLGDAWCNNVPSAYRLVAHYTKSIRFENYDESLFRVFDGVDDMQETLAWIRRFD